MLNQFQISEHVFSCQTGKRTVLLDLFQDRYFVLRDQQSEWFSEIQAAALTSRPLETKASVFARRLCDMGILSESVSGHQNARPLLSVPVSAHYGSVDLNVAKVSMKQFGRFITAAGHAWWLERSCHIAQQMEVGRRWKKKISRSSPVHTDELFELTNSFHKLSPYFFSTHDACRWRSLVLFRYLTLHGIAPDWVFGVRTRPFAAHCWIEAGSVILNDHYETVRPYTPIMKI